MRIRSTLRLATGTLLLAMLPPCGWATAQSVTSDPFGRAHPPRIYQTMRLQGPPPAIDGRLDDEAWQQGDWAGDYTQQLPVEGGSPSERTELKILFDAANVYIAIRAFDDPRRIHRYPGRRDSFGGDIVGVCFDSYFDKRSGFEFDLNAAGTKIDLVLTNEGWDTSWDAVWFGKVGLEPDAWTAEFQIPVNQLRYGPQDEQVWGLHAWRWIDRLQEEDQWNLIPRNGTGRMYNLGELHGIAGLRRSRHVELLPHAVSRVTSAPSADVAGDATAGLDAKIGVTTDFTLDATVNPDFGQVEADPSVVNLTAYETFFEEKRPFFLEGKRIFTFGLEPTTIAGDASEVAGDMLFYSRRIGHAPSYHPPIVPAGAIESPESTSILSAVKITGKTRSGLAVGVLHSVTAEETARLSFDGIERIQPVEPRTSYFAARVQKDWNKGNTIVGGMLTSTDRGLGDAALAFLPRHALTGGIDVVRFVANRSYVLEGKATFSRASGSPEAMTLLQTSPVHYFQRPDATHLSVDPAATSLAGHGGTARIARYGNSKWRLSNTVRWVSPGLDLNDVGYLRQADFVRNETAAGFEQTEPRGPFRSYGVSVERADTWDFGGLRTDGVWVASGNGTFANKWRISAAAHFVDRAIDTRLLRGGPAFEKEPFLGVSVSGTTDPSRRAMITAGVNRHTGPVGAQHVAYAAAGLRLRLARAFSVSSEAFRERVLDDVQYVDTARPTGDARYVLGRLDQETIGATIRADLHLTPDLSVQYYGSPFVSSGGYDRFKRVTDGRAAAYADRFHLFGPDELRYVPQPNTYIVTEAAGAYGFVNPDFSFHEFRSNLVGRWEFRPGSTLYVVWSHDRTGTGAIVDSPRHGFEALARTPATNVFLVKVSHWIAF